MNKYEKKIYRNQLDFRHKLYLESKRINIENEIADHCDLWWNDIKDIENSKDFKFQIDN